MPTDDKDLGIAESAVSLKTSAYCGLQAADQLIHSVNDLDTLSDRMLAVVSCLSSE